MVGVIFITVIMLILFLIDFKRDIKNICDLLKMIFIFIFPSFAIGILIIAAISNVTSFFLTEKTINTIPIEDMSRDANISIYVDFDINENAYMVQTQTGNIKQFDKTQATVIRTPIEKGYVEEIITEYDEVEDLFFFNLNKPRYNIRVPIESYIIIPTN